MVGLCDGKEEEVKKEEQMKRYYIRENSGTELVRVPREEYYLSLLEKEDD
jgi:hypothetical protein